MSDKMLDVYSEVAGRGVLHANAFRPVFIHSSFRTSSTWLWAKLRAAPTITAYCEIFHELFASVTLSDMRDVRYTGWNSGHPACAPYFIEFIPLLEKTGGVAGFEQSMSFESFIPVEGVDGDLSHSEHKYLTSLILNAQSRKTLPILTDTRTLGRVRAVKKFCDCTNVLLYRNLFHQWGSYTWQSISGNNYFIEAMNAALIHSHHDPILKMLDEWFSDRTSKPDNIRLFQTFILFHIYLYSVSIEATDILIDVNLIAKNADQRRMAEEALYSVTFAPIDLSDAQVNFEASVVSIDDPRGFRDELEQFIKLIVDSTKSAKVIKFIDRILDDTLREIESHRFYSGKMIKLYRDSGRLLEEKTVHWERGHLELSNEVEATRAQIDELTSDCRELGERVSQNELERDKLGAQIAEANSHQSDLQSAVECISNERDRITAEIFAARDEKVELLRTIDRTIIERDEAVAQIAAAASARQEMQRGFDKLAAQIAEANAHRSDLQSAVERITSERDQFAAEVVAAREEKARLDATVDRTVIERDEAVAQIAAAATARQVLQTGLDQVVAERDYWMAQFDAAKQIEADLRSEIKFLVSERHTHERQLTLAHEERNDLRMAGEKMTAAHDEAVSKLEALISEQAELRCTIDELVAERDLLFGALEEARTLHLNLESAAETGSLERHELAQQCAAANEAHDQLKEALAQVVGERDQLQAQLSVATRPWFSRR